MTFLLCASTAREYTIHKAASVVVFLRRKSEKQSSVTQEDATPSTAPNRPEAEILAEVKRAEATTAKFGNHDGTVLDDITAVTSSDVCNTVLGHVDKVMQIGDVLSQVIPHHATPCSYPIVTFLFLGPSICETRMAGADACL
jgi:hypothetical protein